MLFVFQSLWKNATKTTNKKNEMKHQQHITRSHSFALRMNWVNTWKSEIICDEKETLAKTHTHTTHAMKIPCWKKKRKKRTLKTKQLNNSSNNNSKKEKAHYQWQNSSSSSSNGEKKIGMKAESKQINKQIILHKMSQMKRVRRENVELQKAVGRKKRPSNQRHNS